jgi:hypothetical protein
MPENKNEKTVDIDTSGPGAEVELDVKLPESNDIEVSNDKDNVKSVDTVAESNEQSDVKADKQDTENKDQGTGSEDTDNKKELEDYSEGVKKRIAKLTKKMREAERQREAAIEYARKIQGEKESLAGRLTKLDTGYVNEMENRIKSSMEAAAAKLAQARTDGDLKLEIAAQTEIAKLGYEDARLSEIKSKQALENKIDNAKPVQDYVDRLREQPIQQEQPINPDPKAQGWAQKNTWFGQDSAMTYTAFDLHKKLVEEEGYDPQSDEYYVEIDKRIRLEFPHKFATNTVQTTNNSKPTQTVASASRTGGKNSSRKTVRLTPSQVAIAKKLGVPLEEYAKQLTTKEV